MKNLRFVVLLVAMLMSLALAAVASAAPSNENPYKEAYKTQAAALRHPGLAQVVYLILDEHKQPLANATVVYNTTKARDQKALSDAQGMVRFETKASELYYLRELVVKGVTIPVTGVLVNDINRNDIHRGAVRWNVVQEYGRTFVSYKAD